MSQVLRKETRPDLMSKEIRPDLISLVGARQTRTSLFFQAETALTRRKIEWSVCRVLLIAGPIRVAFPRRPAFGKLLKLLEKHFDIHCGSSEVSERACFSSVLSVDIVFAASASSSSYWASRCCTFAGPLSIWCGFLKSKL